MGVAPADRPALPAVAGRRLSEGLGSTARGGWCAKHCRRLHALCRYDQPWPKPPRFGRIGCCCRQAGPEPLGLEAAGLTCCYLCGDQAATGHGRGGLWFRSVCSRSAAQVELRRWRPLLVLGASSALIGVRQVAANALHGLAARSTAPCAGLPAASATDVATVLPNVRAKADHGGRRRKAGTR
jgi:hypothetical protein